MLFSGQLRRDVQLGQRLLPQFSGGDDHPELLDGYSQAHQTLIMSPHDVTHTRCRTKLIFTITVIMGIEDDHYYTKDIMSRQF